MPANADVTLDARIHRPFQANIGFAIALAVFTSIVIVALMNIQLSLEDPYDDYNGLDDVRVRNVFREMERLISIEWKPGVWEAVVTKGADLRDAKCDILDLGARDVSARGPLRPANLASSVAQHAHARFQNSQSFDTTHGIYQM